MDPRENRSGTTYDPSQRMVESLSRIDGITQYEYDTEDRLRKVTAPNGVITEYEYDLLSRKTKEISSDRGTVSYTYDLANNLTSMTDGRGITSTYAYDQLERPISKTYPNTITDKIENVSYTYDSCTLGVGRLCQVQDESGVTSYTYDTFGNVTRMSKVELGITYVTDYTYDEGNRLITMTLPSGRQITYSRDGIRRLQAIETEVNGALQNIISNIQYRSDSQMTQSTFGNGLIDTRGYDQQGRLTNQRLRTATDAVIDERSYRYDQNSNILNIDTNVEDNAYTYDPRDRIVGDRIDQNESFLFDYDLNDNRQSKAQATGIQQLLSYAPASNRVSFIDTVQRDATAPALASLPERELVYNDANRLYQLIEDGTLTTAYRYNDGGQRTRKITYQSDGQTVDTITVYHYDMMGYLVTETTETGALIKDYIWREGMNPVAQIVSTTGAEQVSYLHTDHLMTNRLATNPAQQVVWRWEGEAFGNTPAQELASIQVNLRFPGQYYDAETNLHYNMMRYYDPELGRYITSDPIGLLAGFNTYLYANANAINSYDSNGLLPGPDPNGVIPGGPWTRAEGQRGGDWQGPKQKKGPRTLCRWVPEEGKNGPPGSKGYWKTKAANQNGWQRYDRSGKPISKNQAHKMPKKGGGGRGGGGAGGGCFVENTMVLTSKGDKPIEDISIGDIVYSFNFERGISEWKKVINTFVHQRSDLIELIINSKQTIISSSNHKYFIVNKNEYVEARNIKAGDGLLESDGNKVIISQVKIVDLLEPVKVYNFTVEGNHNYYVSKKGVLVSNTKTGPGPIWRSRI